jgi:NTE family protein
MRSGLLGALLCACACAAVADTQTLAGDGAQTDTPAARPKIGLALSGGGARGAAHIGVLRVLEEQRIPIDYIAGTSMGAVIGGLYAAGLDPDVLERMLTEIDWADASTDRIQRKDRSFRRKRDDDLYLIRAAPGISDKGQVRFPAGLVQGQKIDLLLKSFTTAVAQVQDFDQLRIPFRAVAADIVTGELVALGSGDLATAIRASMSIPAVLAPVEIDGRLLVDGGVASNLPISIVREMGADIIIAVDVTTALLDREALTSVLAIADQLTTLLTRRNSEAEIATLRPQDVLIAPNLGDITFTDFDRAPEALALGATATRAQSGLLQALSVPEPQYDAYLRAHRHERTPDPIIDFVRIDNQSGMSDEALEARLRIQPGEPLDVVELRRDIDRIYGMELFENVNYEIVRERGQTGIVLHVRERSWGPNYLRFGMALADDFKNNDFFNLAAAYSRTLINSLGGEWRTGLAIGGEPGVFSELYQPLDADTRYFIEPSLSISQRTVPVIEGRNQVAELSIEGWGGTFAVGREFGSWGELRLGIARFTGETSVHIGNPRIPDEEFDVGNLYLRLAADELDNSNFPRDGLLAGIEWRHSMRSLGADVEFDQLDFTYLKALTRGRHTLIMRAQAGTTFSGTAPIESVFRTGGFLNISGLDQSSLSGQHYGLLSVGTLRRLGDITLLPAYVGTSLEIGNVWQDDDDIGLDDLRTAGSLFLGLDSFIGPLYIGYGRTEGGQASFYLFLGRIF